MTRGRQAEHADHFETACARCVLDAHTDSERAGIEWRYGRAADEGLGDREGIIHAPRLTCIYDIGLALCAASSIS